MGRKKVAKAPTKKMSFEVSKGVLTNKLQNIKQLMELMRGDAIAKDNKYLMTFQNFLNNIPKWSSEIVENEKQKV